MQIPGTSKTYTLAQIVEFPQEPLRAARRDPYSGFVAYVPKGSIGKGEALVKTGAGGKTIACTACHGQRLEGIGEVPGIAGISPLYAFRQLRDAKSGARGGPSAELMKPVVAQLTADDMIAIVAYLASLNP